MEDLTMEKVILEIKDRLKRFTDLRQLTDEEIIMVCILLKCEDACIKCKNSKENDYMFNEK